MILRRDLLIGTVAAAAALSTTTPSSAAPSANGTRRYGLIGKMSVKPGQRDAVLALLLDGITDIPGCLSYVLAEDRTDPDGIWITEVWDSERSHDASLSLPHVRDVIAKARPLIAGFGERHETTPVGDVGAGATR